MMLTHVVVVLTFSLLLPSPSIADDAIPWEDTQAGMTEAAEKGADAAEAEMRRVLERLVKEAAGKPEAVAKLRKAQAAWEQYRDAELEVRWPFAERGRYGSVYPMCLADRREALTRERVRALRSLLGEGEGDACTPEWPE